MCVCTEVACYLDKAIGIRAVLGTYDQQQIRVRSYLFHCDLAILGRIANVLRGRAFNVGEFLFQRGDDVFGFVETKRGLSQVRHAIWIRNGERLYLFRRPDNLRDQWSFAESSDNFVVIVMTDQDQRIALLGKLYSFNVNLCN